MHGETIVKWLAEKRERRRVRVRRDDVRQRPLAGGESFSLSSQPLSIIRGKGLSYKKVHTHEGKTVGEGSEGDSGFVACVREQVDRQV